MGHTLKIPLKIQTETVLYNCCAHTLKLIKALIFIKLMLRNCLNISLKFHFRKGKKEGLDSK